MSDMNFNLLGRGKICGSVLLDDDWINDELSYDEIDMTQYQGDLHNNNDADEDEVLDGEELWTELGLERFFNEVIPVHDVLPNESELAEEAEEEEDD